MSGRRVEMGFEGGTILRLTIEESAAQALVGSLANGGATGVPSRPRKGRTG